MHNGTKTEGCYNPINKIAFNLIVIGSWKMQQPLLHHDV